MSVRLVLDGGLGSNLAQYAIGRIIASRLGFSLDCFRMGAPLPGTAFRHGLVDCRGAFPKAPLHLGGLRAEGAIESYELGGRTDWTGNCVPLAEILANPEPRQIRLHGFFQQCDLFIGSLPDLRNWFDAGPSKVPVQAVPGDVVVHVNRGASVAREGWVLPAAYYREALEAIGNHRRLYVCGEGLDAPLRALFGEFGGVSLALDPLDQFRLIRSCERVVLSNSVLAWWAAFLSQSQAVWAPHASTGSGFAFTGYSDVDLDMRRVGYNAISVEEFVPIDITVRSLVQGGRLWKAGNHFVVGRPGGAPAHILGTDAMEELLLSLCRHATLGPIRSHVGFRSEAGRLFKTLAREGVVTLDYRVADDTPDDPT